MTEEEVDRIDRRVMVFTVLALAVIIGIIVCETVSSDRFKNSIVQSPVPTVSTPFTDPHDAYRYLKDWADRLPANSANHSARSEILIVSNKDDPGRWSVALHRGSEKTDIEKFRCIAITSGSPTPFEYPTVTESTMVSIIFDDDIRCDTSGEAVRRVGTRYSPEALDGDWGRLSERLGSPEGRANPYLVANTVTTPLASYTVVESKIVSTTETRLLVRQTATGTDIRPCDELDNWRCEDVKPRVQL